mmetsp:Transcript_76403/g.181722  ORF Transcript_76403/g.181722 Transcript_76403/m.181722 type:complete len:875 (-) Transcript_76403:41-2665(-)
MNGRPSTGRSKRAITKANLETATTAVKLDEGLFPSAAGKRPWFTPSSVPLDLIFFRRVFSILNQRYGQGTDEVPCAVFQRTVVRLFHMMNFPHVDFNSQDYDVDGSGAVGWYEFVTCWQTSKIRMGLSNIERVFFAMEDPSSCRVGTLISWVITFLIFVSCICFMLGTLPTYKKTDPNCPRCEPQQLEEFEILEMVSVGVFTLEYLVRAGSAPFSRSELLDYERILEILTEYEQFRKPSPFVRFIVFTLQPMNIVDLLVITPFYIEAIIGWVAGNLAVLRVIRLTRLFRLVKLGRYIDVMQLIVRVFRRSLRALNVLYLYLVLGICFSSALMYYVEGGYWDADLQDYVREYENGDKEVTPFKSIPHTFWWCVTTFTTTGYGEVVPITPLGKVVAGCTMLTGLLVLAMPISVISLNFATVWSDWNEEKRLEAEALEQDMVSVTEALEVLKSRTRLFVQVFDDDAGEGMKGEILGEVDIRDLPVESSSTGVPAEAVTVDDVYPLYLGSHHSHAAFTAAGSIPSGHNKRGSGKGAITGQLLLGYTWTPTPGLEQGISGTLEIRLRCAENLPICDWREGQTRDVYAVVHCWPKPPPPGQKVDEGGAALTNSETFQTTTVRGTLNPVWNEKATFEFDWPWNWRPAEPSTPNLSSKDMNGASYSGALGATSNSFLDIQQKCARGYSFEKKGSQQSLHYLGSVNSSIMGIHDGSIVSGRRESASSLSPLVDRRDNELRAMVVSQGREIKALRHKLDDVADMMAQMLGKEPPGSTVYTSDSHSGLQLPSPNRRDRRTRTSESNIVPLLDDGPVQPPPSIVLQEAREASDQHTAADGGTGSLNSPVPNAEDLSKKVDQIVAPTQMSPALPPNSPMPLPGEVGH